MIVIQDDSTRYNSNTYLVPYNTLARYHILYISISTLTTPYPRPHRGRPPASPLTEPCALHSRGGGRQ